MTVPQPTPTTRWRCTACGNLTRFDVTRSSRVVEFVHLDLAGQSTVEERQVLRDMIERIRCRWCDAVDRVELVPRADADADADADATPGLDGQAAEALEVLEDEGGPGPRPGPSTGS